MLTKVFKKLIALSLLLFLCSSTLPSFAVIYSPGPITYDLEKEYLIELNNASTNGKDLIFNAGGKVKYDLLLPFDSDSVTVKYASPKETVSLDIVIDDETYNLKLYEGSTTSTVAIAETVGSHTLTFKASAPFTLKGVTFNKINEKYPDRNSGVTPLTDYGYAVLTSVIVKNDASVVKTKGSMQRWDMENNSLTPMNLNGSLYVPFAKISEALGFYWEDYPDKSYIYVTGETQSLTLINGKGRHETDTDQGREVTLDVVYKNGLTWVPLRNLAEMLGFTVEYREGYAVVDGRIEAKNVVRDDQIFKELKKEFSEFIVTGKETKGKTYHVAQTSKASDANSGSEEYPFLTIDRAAQIAKAGDTVIIHEGTYREILKPKNNGTYFAPITFMAAEGEQVTISALEPISNFVKYKDDIYVASMTVDLGKGRNQLFYKGEALVEGRHPNEHNSYKMIDYVPGIPAQYPIKGDIRIRTESSHKGDVPEDAHWAYSDTSLNQTEKDYWKGGTFVTMKGEAWNLVSGDIIASEYGRIKLKNHDNFYSYGLGMSFPQGGSYRYYPYVSEQDFGYITDHLNTVDKPGEWFIGDKLVYVIPPEGADLDEDFEVKERQLVMDLRNKRYITIKNIDTIGGGMTMSGKNCKGNILNGGTHKYVSHHTQITDPSRYQLDTSYKQASLHTVKSGEVGFFFDGEMNSLVNSVVDFSSAAGVIATGRYQYISNNIISNASYAGGYPGCVWFCFDTSSEDYMNMLQGGHFLTRNTVFNSVRGVLLQGSSHGDIAYGITPNEIAYNRFFNGALTTRDTGVTYEYGYTGGNDKAKTSMHHNFVYDPGYADEGYLGSHTFILYHDGLVANRRTYNNVVYNANPNVEAAEYVHDSAASVLRSSNNAELGFLPNGEADITIEDFPGERPFNPGSFQSFDEQYLVQYESFKAGRVPQYWSRYTADEETGTESYIFEDVEIPDNKYVKMDIFMLRKYGASATFDIKAEIYDINGDVVKEVTLKNSVTNKRFYVYDVLKGLMVLPAMEGGTYTIRLTFSDMDSDVMRIQINEAPNDYWKIFRTDIEFGGSYDDHIVGQEVEIPLSTATNTALSRLLASTHWNAANLWDNTLIYKDRKVLQKSDMLRIVYSTGTPYDGTTMRVYVDSMDTEPIATFVHPDTRWKQQTAYIKLDRELEPGKHTFYFDFSNEDTGRWCCSSIYNFKFIDDEDEEWQEEMKTLGVK